MERIRCFVLEPTNLFEQSLRRYVGARSGGECKESPTGYHNASTIIAKGIETDGISGDRHPHDDTRWPHKCVCGYGFKENDQWQLNNDRLYRKVGTTEMYTLRGAPVGAMWYADWYPWKGPDGRTLVVNTPGWNWIVDSRANNCTMPKDNEHRCWVREGTPPNVTVNKKGLTCGAGAGSISQPGYHGFLRNGYLERC